MFRKCFLTEVGERPYRDVKLDLGSNNFYLQIHVPYLYVVIQVAVSRSNHQFPNDTEDSNKPNKEDRAKLLLDWALDDFKPGGPEAFETIKG